MYEWDSCLTLTPNVDWGILLITTFPTQGPQWRSAPPPEAPSTEPLQRERDVPSPEPHSSISQSPVDKPSSSFPKRGPYAKRCPSPGPFLPILQGPQQGSPPSRFPSQSSHRERLHLQSPLQPHLKVPGRWAHSMLPNRAPMKSDAHPRAFLS